MMLITNFDITYKFNDNNLNDDKINRSQNIRSKVWIKSQKSLE